MPSIRDLFVSIGFDVDDKALSSVDAGLNSIKNAAIGAGIAISGMSLVIGGLLKKAGDFEQTEVTFEALLGSVEAGQAKIEELLTFAKNTPFSIDGVFESAKKILAMNTTAEDLIPTMKMLGDTAAGLKVPLNRLAINFGQVKSLGRLMRREVNDFANAGVDIISIIAESEGKSKQEISALITKGQVGFDAVEKAFIKLTTGTGKFANLMERLSKTFSGSVAKIAEVFDIIALSVGKKLLPEAKKLTKQFLKFLEANDKIIKSKISKFMLRLFKQLKVILAIIGRMISFLKLLTKAFGGLENSVFLAIQAMFLMFGATMLFGIGKVIAGIGTLISTFKKLGFVATIAQAKMILIPLLLGALFLAFLLVLEDIKTFFEDGESFTGDFIKIFKEKFPKAFELSKKSLIFLKKTFIAIKDTIMGLKDIMVGLFFVDLDQIQKGMDKVVEVFKKGFKTIAPIAESAFSQIPSKIQEATIGVKDIVVGVASFDPAQLGTGLQTLFDLSVDKFGGIFNTSPIIPNAISTQTSQNSVVISPSISVTVQTQEGATAEQTGQSIGDVVVDVINPILRQAASATATGLR